MAGTATIVIFDLSKSLSEDIKRAVNERLSRTEQPAVYFLEYGSLEASKDTAINESIMASCSAPFVSPGRLNVVLVYDGQPANAGHMRTITDEYNNTAALNGISVRFSLILAPDELPILRVRYRDIIDKIPYGTGAAVYHAVYVLSNKNSRFGSCAGERADAAALIIYATEENLINETGVFTAGTGKRSTSAGEVREYARSVIAGALKKGTLSHAEFTDINVWACDAAFSGDPLESLNDFVSKFLEAFVYIEGQEWQHKAPDEGKNAALISDYCAKWQEKLLKNIASHPFAGEVQGFFGERGGFDAYINSLQLKLAAMEPKMPDIKAGLFSGNKGLALAYNSYRKNRAGMREQVCRALCDELRALRGAILDEAIRLAHEAYDVCAGYCADEAFISDFGARNPALARDAEDVILGSCAFTKADLCENFATEPECWDAFMDKCIALAFPPGTASSIVAQDAQKAPGEIVNGVFAELNRRADAYMAYSRYGRLGQPVKQLYFVPRSFPVSTISRALEIKGVSGQVFCVGSQSYSNEEELALYRTGSVGATLMSALEGLTAFADISVTGAGNAFKDRAAEEGAPALCRQNHLDKSAAAAEDWNMRIMEENGRYYAYFNWVNRKLDIINCFISPKNGMPGKNVQITQSQFRTAGRMDITLAVSDGGNTAVLKVGDEELSRCEFAGQMHLCIFEANQSECSLSGIEFIKYELRLVGIDNAGPSAADDKLLNNLEVVAGENGAVRLPYPPKIKHGIPEWTVFSNGAPVSVRTCGICAAGYETVLR